MEQEWVLLNWRLLWLAEVREEPARRDSSIEGKRKVFLDVISHLLNESLEKMQKIYDRETGYESWNAWEEYIVRTYGNGIEIRRRSRLGLRLAAQLCHQG